MLAHHDRDSRRSSICVLRDRYNRGEDVRDTLGCICKTWHGTITARTEHNFFNDRGARCVTYEMIPHTLSVYVQ